jgi:hypothetical protein
MVAVMGRNGIKLIFLASCSAGRVVNFFNGDLPCFPHESRRIGSIFCRVLLLVCAQIEFKCGWDEWDSVPSCPEVSGWFAMMGQFRNLGFVPPQPVPSQTISQMQSATAEVRNAKRENSPDYHQT